MAVIQVLFLEVSTLLSSFPTPLECISCEYKENATSDVY
jgi:hypothetical protein